MSERALLEQVSGVPDEPGVYLWKGAGGGVLYVGKAKSLRKRMRQYVLGQDERESVALLMAQVVSFDYVVAGNEVESLILEKNLIRQFRPAFNVDYRDDKSYPFIAITTEDPYPAIKFTREKRRAGTRYFGPYTDARAARETIDVVRRIYPICSAQCVEWKRVNAKGGAQSGKACFDYHVGKGPGPCVGAVTRSEYAQNVANVLAFLHGRQRGVADELERRMRRAAEDLDYERAARFRNQLDAIRRIEQRQTVVSARPLEIDVAGFFREETIAGVHVFVVREGRVLIGNEFVLDKGFDVGMDELVEGFLLRYYDEAGHVPREIILPALPESTSAIEEWLSGQRGSAVRLTLPKRGEKRRLLELAEVNARHTLMRHKVRTRYDDERINRALLELESALSLPRSPLRIECYDISTLHGRHSVGSMAVFTNGKPDSSAYRRFRVKRPDGTQDDVGMMGELLRRRFAVGRVDDQRFALARPDLVIVDGGTSQLAAASAALEAVGAPETPVAALSKREEELWLPGRDEPVLLPTGSASLYLVKRIRDEAHRFAVTYHRELRGRAMKASVLDDIPGIGPQRKKQLLKAFGSVRKMRDADVDEIASVPGIPHELARDIVAVLRQQVDAGGGSS